MYCLQRTRDSNGVGEGRVNKKDIGDLIKDILEARKKPSTFKLPVGGFFKDFHHNSCCGKVYNKCGACGKMVRLNKPVIGSLHICVE